MKAILARNMDLPMFWHWRRLTSPHRKVVKSWSKYTRRQPIPSYWHRMEGKIPMLRQMYGDPQPTDPTMGGDCAGTVVAIGKDVTRFTVGDAVFGAAKGAFAEYAIAAERISSTSRSVSLLWMPPPSQPEGLRLCRGYVTRGTSHPVSVF
jgi:hypothetical protein